MLMVVHYEYVFANLYNKCDLDCLIPHQNQLTSTKRFGFNGLLLVAIAMGHMDLNPYSDEFLKIY